MFVYISSPIIIILLIFFQANKHMVLLHLCICSFICSSFFIGSFPGNFPGIQNMLLFSQNICFIFIYSCHTHLNMGQWPRNSIRWINKWLVMDGSGEPKPFSYQEMYTETMQYKLSYALSLSEILMAIFTDICSLKWMPQQLMNVEWHICISKHLYADIFKWALLEDWFHRKSIKI